MPFDPATARWIALGRVVPSGPPDDVRVGPIVGFAGGYVALGEYEPIGPVAWFSTDGTRWSATPLAILVRNCPDWGPAGEDMVFDAELRGITTNGTEVLIVGEARSNDAAACGNLHPVAWHSADGRTWTRSAPFETTSFRAVAAWATPEGWQALTEGGQIFESADGLGWRTIGSPLNGMDFLGATLDGTVVVRALDPPGGTTTVRLVSDDGRTWVPLAPAEGCDGSLLPPREPGLAAWVALGLVNDPSSGKLTIAICSSPDLAVWSRTPVTEWIGPAAQTRFGAIVLGDACFGAGATCDPEPRAWLGTDGVRWAPLAHPPVAWDKAIADGPAGVLVVGSGAADPGATTVWRLVP